MTTPTDDSRAQPDAGEREEMVEVIAEMCGAEA